MQKKTKSRQKRRGSGGMWRAFCKQQTQGSIGRPDLAQVALEYQRLRAERPDELEGVRRAGAVATHNKVIKRGGNAFGLVSRTNKTRSKFLSMSSDDVILAQTLSPASCTDLLGHQQRSNVRGRQNPAHLAHASAVGKRDDVVWMRERPPLMQC